MCHDQWHVFRVRRQKPHSGSLPTLGTTLVLPMAPVCLLRLQKQGAKSVFPNCACHLAQKISAANAAVQELYTTFGLLPASIV